ASGARRRAATASTSRSTTSPRPRWSSRPSGSRPGPATGRAVCSPTSAITCAWSSAATSAAPEGGMDETLATSAPTMAVHSSGRGPDVVMFHGGMGCWKHWIRNVGPLSERFAVHALDHPSYGASAPVSRETTGPEYLDLMHRLVGETFPGTAP